MKRRGIAVVLAVVAAVAMLAGIQTSAAARTVAADDALTISRIDTTGLGAGSPAMAIGKDGFPIVSYVRSDGAGGLAVRVVHCQDSTCTGFAGHNIDTGINVSFQLTSMKIGADGNPVLVYLSTVCCLAHEVKLASCVDTICSRADIRIFAFADQDVEGKPSVTIGGDGLPLVTYEDKFAGNTTDQVVNVVHCLLRNCSSTRFTTIARTGGRGTPGSSVTTGTNGLGVIAYHDAPFGNGALVVTACGNPDCSAGNTTTTIDSTRALDTGVLPSIAIGSDGNPLIGYTDVNGSESSLKIAHCLNPACTASTVTVAASGGTTGLNTSIAIGADGLGVASFHDFSRNLLRVAHCVNVVCTSTVSTTIDDHSGGSATSIAIGGHDGLPVMVYAHLLDTPEVRVAHCADAACAVPVPQADFDIALSKTSGTVVAGNSTTTSVSLIPINGFSRAADLSASGLPAGVTATFTPGKVSAGAPATLTLATSASSPVGGFPITVTAGDRPVPGRLKTATYQLTIASAAPGFTIDATPATGTLQIPGSPAGTTVFLSSANGFTGSATLSVLNLPAGVTASLSSTQVSADNPVELTLSSEDSPEGVFPVRITATAAGGKPQVTDFLLTIEHNGA